MYIFNCLFISSLKSRQIVCVNCIKPIFIYGDRISVRYAGHSHWKNIAKTKAVKDLEKSRMYNYYISNMKKAARS